MSKRLPPINGLLMILGTFFFFNPNLSVLDVLPDFIGAALIVIGMLHLADIDDRAKDASRALTVLALVDAGKMLCLLLLTDADGTVWPLIFTFCFGIGEGALFAYGMAKLFSAITYQAMRHSCQRLYTDFSSLLGLTVLVAILKNLLVMLPEFTGLSTDYGFIENIAGTEAQVSEFIYKALTILNLVVVTLYGLGWWIYMVRYFRAVSREKDFLLALDEKYYEEVGSKHEVLTYRALKMSGLLFTLGLIMLLPLRLDGNDLLPDFGAGLLLLLGVLRLYGLYKKSSRAALIAGGVYTLIAATEWIYELVFNRSLNVQGGGGFYDTASVILLRHPRFVPAYFLLCGISILKYLALAVFLWFVCKVFYKIIKDHTGASTELAEEIGARKTQLIHRDLGKWLNVLRVAAFFAAGSGLVFRLFRMFSDSMIMQYVDPVFTCLLLVAFLVFHSKLSEGIDNKYYCARE